MKAVLKFLITTGIGKELIAALVRLVLRIVRKKIQEHPDFPIDEILRISDDEIHATVQSETKYLI